MSWALCFNQLDRVFNCVSLSLGLAANERSSALEGPLPSADRPALFSFLSLLVYTNCKPEVTREGTGRRGGFVLWESSSVGLSRLIHENDRHRT